MVWLSCPLLVNQWLAGSANDACDDGGNVKLFRSLALVWRISQCVNWVPTFLGFVFTLHFYWSFPVFLVPWHYQWVLQSLHLNHLKLPLPLFSQCHCCQAILHNVPYGRRINFPFYSGTYPSITNHYRHRAIHFSLPALFLTTLSITLYTQP